MDICAGWEQDLKLKGYPGSESILMNTKRNGESDDLNNYMRSISTHDNRGRGTETSHNRESSYDASGAKTATKY